MPMGTITINIQDGQLGLVAPNTSQTVVVMGCCSATNANVLQSFSQISDIVGSVGSGPAPEAAAYQLIAAGGSVYIMPVNKTVAGTISNLQVNRAASSTGTISSTGTPNDYYNLLVSIVSSGIGQKVANSNVAVRVSLDGGQTYGGQVLIPANGTLALNSVTGAVKVDTGLTLQFSVASTTYDQGDTVTAVCDAPTFSDADLTTAFTALLGDPRTWGLVHVVGYNGLTGNPATDQANAALQANTIIGQMQAAAAQYRYARAIMGIPDPKDGYSNMTQGTADGYVIAAFAATGSDPRLVRAATTDNIISALTGMLIERPHSFGLVGRLAKINASRSPGIVDDGALPNVVSTNRDERKYPGLYDQGFAVARTVIGRAGVYCDFGRTSAPATSDYSNIMNGRVMDLIANACVQAALHFQNTEIRVTSTGAIYPSDARTIATYITNTIMSVAGTEISQKPIVTVNTTNDILSTQTLVVNVRAIPFGYAKNVTMNIGFENPNIVQP